MLTRRRGAICLAFCLGVCLFAATPAFSQNCPGPLTPVPTITSPLVPGDVCIPPSFPQNQNPIQFFDDYSWRAFVAVVWPTSNGQRGQPDTSKAVGDPGPRVFETFKASWEIFHNDGSAPEPTWNSFDDPKFNACNARIAYGDLVLASFSKFSELGEATNGGLIGPLVAQNGTYVRYATGFNKIEFNQISSDGLFNRNNLPMKMPFQNGALDVPYSLERCANIILRINTDCSKRS